MSVNDFKTPAFSVVSTTQCITGRAGPSCNLTSETYSCKLETGSGQDKTVLSAVLTQSETRQNCLVSSPSAVWTSHY